GDPSIVGGPTTGSRRTPTSARAVARAGRREGLPGGPGIYLEVKINNTTAGPLVLTGRQLLPVWRARHPSGRVAAGPGRVPGRGCQEVRSEEHTSELQS